jgi:hypothetical protein
MATKTCVVGAAMAALSAIIVSSAVAGTPVTSAAAWVKTEGAVSKTVSEESGKCSRTKTAEPFVLKSKVSGSPLELTATGISCASMTLKTTGSGSASMAIAEGQLTLEGVSIMHPESCSTPSTITTNTVVGDLKMNEAHPEKSFLKLTPKSGEGEALATVKLEACGSSGSYTLKGALLVEATERTQEHKILQEFAGDETTHAMSSLTLGGEAATLTGVFGLELGSGLSWGAEPIEEKAGPVTDPAAWVKTEGGVKQTVSEENITCRHTPEEAQLVFKAKVLGSTIKLTATGLNCTGAKIKTTGSGATSMAIAEGQIELTGVSVDEPAGCKTSAAIKTNALVADLQMDNIETAKSYVAFTAAAGAGSTITTIKLEGCAAVGSYPLKGVVYFEATDPTEGHTVAQHLAGTEATDAFSALKLGSEAATLTGEVEIELASGLAWGAEGL